tara:strand:+ start:524 stop:1066 length:543 start_codon:yes stop_codon:yes gene_type:complete
MKKAILIFGLLIMVSCTNSAVTEENNEKFEQQIKSWETFTEGFYNEDIDLLMSVVADSVQWSPPNYNGNKLLGYEEFKEAVLGYFDNFNEITFNPGEGLIGSDYAYWSGSLYSQGDTNTDPSVMRIYGTWSSYHTATGAPVNNKWYGVINFNEDNKFASFSDWMDVNGMQVQINEYIGAN